MDKAYEMQPGIVTDLPLSLVDFDPEQPRKDVPRDHIDELAASIKAAGVKQPITVRPNPDEPGRFYVVYGECRTRASRKARKKTIPALLEAEGTDELTRLLDQVRENEHRRGLNPMELADVLKRLQSDFGCKSHKAIEETLNTHGLKSMSRSYVANTVRLLDLPEWAQEKIRRGELTAAHGKYLLPATASRTVLDHMEAALQQEERQNITTAALQGLVYNAFQRYHEDLGGHYVAFDQAEACDGCKKRRSVSAPHAKATFCLDEECFDLKNSAAQAEQRAARERAREEQQTQAQGPTEVEPDEDGRVNVDGLHPQIHYAFIDMAPFDTTECTICEHCHPVAVMSGDRDACFNMGCYNQKRQGWHAEQRAEQERKDLVTATLRDCIIRDHLPDDEALQLALVSWTAMGQPAGARSFVDGEHVRFRDIYDFSDNEEIAESACLSAGLVKLDDFLAPTLELYPIARYIVQTLDSRDLFTLARRQRLSAADFTCGAGWCQSQTTDRLIDRLIESGHHDETDRARLAAMSKDELTARIVELSLPWPNALVETWERLISQETQGDA